MKLLFLPPPLRNLASCPFDLLGVAAVEQEDQAHGEGILGFHAWAKSGSGIQRKLRRIAPVLKPGEQVTRQRALIGQREFIVVGFLKIPGSVERG